MPHKMAEILLKNNMIDFLASNLLNHSQMDWLEKALKLKNVQKSIMRGELLNDTIL